MKKSSSENGRILKSHHSMHDVKPFLLRSVDNSAGGGQAAQEYVDEDEIERLRQVEDAFEKGFKEGLDAGRLQMLKELSNELNLVRSLIDGVQKLSAGIYGMIEADIVELSIAMAKKIVYEAAEKERDVVVNTVREAIKKTSDRETLKIKISPVDYDILSKNKSEFLHLVDGVKNILFDVDEKIHPGGCMVETNHGDVDARIDSQFTIIEEEVRRAGNVNTQIE
ncbi:MAG: hypothetical protein HZA08_03155 [Nitrospirae bacterium]|nr:hypothetical protein [Nitrospirota bacterium]